MNPYLGVALIGAVAVTGWARADDWQTGVGGNAARHGLSEEIGPSAQDILWQGSLPAIVSQQAAIDGTIVVTSRIASSPSPPAPGSWPRTC